MILKKGMCIFLFAIVSNIAVGQITISEFIQESKIADSNKNKLYFVDFWATWCAPCIVAKEQLTVLQEQFPEDFYIVSLSSENPTTVEGFLKRKPTKLAIAMDYDRATFKKYKIRELPQGILFNAHGDVLWRGSSASLTSGIISKFLRQSNKRIALNDFFNVMDYNLGDSTSYMPSKPLEIKQLKESIEFIVSETSNYLKLRGNVTSIYGYLSSIYTGQIDVASNYNKTYEVYFKKPFTSREDLIKLFLDELKLSVDKISREGVVLNLNVNTPNFWDSNQIDWGTKISKYIIGDTDITADNVALKGLSYLLATVLDMPVVISGYDISDTTLYDWQIHHKFFNLMQNNFADYGIAIEKSNKKYDVYQLKKTP